MFRFVRLSASCRVVGFEFVSFRFVGCGTCNINARHLFPTDLVWHVPSNHSTLHTLLSPLHCTSLYSTHSPHSPQGTRVARYVPRCVGMMGQRRDTLARNLRLVNVPNYMRRQSSLPVDSSPGSPRRSLSLSLDLSLSLSLYCRFRVCARRKLKTRHILTDPKKVRCLLLLPLSPLPLPPSYCEFMNVYDYAEKPLSVSQSLGPRESNEHAMQSVKDHVWNVA